MQSAQPEASKHIKQVSFVGGTHFVIQGTHFPKRHVTHALVAASTCTEALRNPRTTKTTKTFILAAAVTHSDFSRLFKFNNTGFAVAQLTPPAAWVMLSYIP